MKAFEGQLLHLVLLAALLAGVMALARGDVLAGSFLGVGTPAWLWASVLVPILHQVYVAFAWRAQLHHQLLTRWCGARAFPRYRAGFVVLILLRPLTLVALAVSNRGTLPIPPLLGGAIAVVCFLPGTWLLHSIRRYFTFDRAFGIDHFDRAYRHVPLVREGIFGVVPNAMYVVGFLSLWGVACLLRSQAALLVAAFQHLYILVHYVCTERPDMRVLYGEDPGPGASPSA